MNMERGSPAPDLKGARIMMTKEKAIERVFDRCNLIGENVDILEIMYKYKAIRDLPEDEIDRIYDDIADRLGFHQNF